MRGFLPVVAALGFAGCTPRPESPDPDQPASAAPGSACSTAPIPIDRAPQVIAEHTDPEFWLGKLGPAADEILLDEATILALERRMLEVDGAWRDPLSDEVGDQARVSRDLASRAKWLQKRITAGEQTEGHPGVFAEAMAIVDGATPIDELRLIVAESQAWCIPTRDGIFAAAAPGASPDPEFDRNLCSSLHPGELVRASRRSADGQWWHVHAGHSVGWLPTPVWTPALAPATARAFRDDIPRLNVLEDGIDVAGIRLRVGTSLPILADDDHAWTVQVPRTTGLESATLTTQPGLRTGMLAFSRRNLFELALAQLDAPYGWGGHAGGRDCSSFLLDDFAAFGIRLARHSSVQAQLGSESVSLLGLDEATKRARIREAAQRGVVLLHMPGHIMLYLGQDGAHDYGVSSLSEFLIPCPGGPDTVYRLDRVAVTTLDLGRGTQRTAFIERIDRMAVFGRGGG